MKRIFFADESNKDEKSEINVTTMKFCGQMKVKVTWLNESGSNMDKCWGNSVGWCNTSVMKSNGDITE